MPDTVTPRILLIGSNGQVGAELQRTLAPLGTVIAHDRTTLDLTDLNAIRRAVEAAAPDVIVNAAAYTHVDRAESEPALAELINTSAPAMLARASADSGAILVHYSTDYVFDGLATVPYAEGHATNPLNVYGRSKRDGDSAVLESGARAYLFRVSWVYGTRGRNFLQTMHRLVAEGKPLRIVADQFGAPTWSRAIAEATTAAIAMVLRGVGSAVPAPGAYHMAAPDHTTWAGFAQAIVEGILPAERRPVIVPISTAEYPTPAARPRWSVLDSNRLGIAFGIHLAPWREQLAECLADTTAEGS